MRVNPAHAKVGLFPAKDKRIGRFYYTRKVRIKGASCAVSLAHFAWAIAENMLVISKANDHVLFE